MVDEVGTQNQNECKSRVDDEEAKGNQKEKEIRLEASQFICFLRGRKFS